MDFLLMANFWKCAVFFVSDFIFFSQSTKSCVGSNPPGGRLLFLVFNLINILFWRILDFLDNIFRESWTNLVRVANQPKFGGSTLLPTRLHTTCIYLLWFKVKNSHNKIFFSVVSITFANCDLRISKHQRKWQNLVIFQKVIGYAGAAL